MATRGDGVGEIRIGILALCILRNWASQSKAIWASWRERSQQICMLASHFHFQLESQRSRSKSLSGGYKILNIYTTITQSRVINTIWNKTRQERIGESLKENSIGTGLFKKNWELAKTGRLPSTQSILWTKARKLEGTGSLRVAGLWFNFPGT